MTLPRASSPELMRMASFKRCPAAPVRLFRSLPAKSTRWNLEDTNSCPITWPFVPYNCLFCSINIVKMACERDDSSFIRVLPVERVTLPLSKQFSISSFDCTDSSDTPTIIICPSAFSRMAIFFGDVSGINKSRSSS